ncbi:MAG: endonuclease/exonuclease/phosphatase family protein [Clostridia bacterium]|nr:endonuclease/exonuclease/phosphatase family protein [Clostridia bacterium]
MKKVISVILAVVITLGCFAVTASAAPAKSFMTESGVEVFIESMLYKTDMYQMQFPSPEDYSVKLSSTEGDYAIPGEINDLSYIYIFPAGTTKFSCTLSLNGEDNWHGVHVNCEEHIQYWGKDENGNVDLTQPVVFDRPEHTAEQDEYGLLYRYMLWNKDLGGFRDYNKLYWKLEYTCNGEVFTDCFEIPLVDYASPDKFSVKMVNYNVGGLPWMSNAAKQERNAEFIVENGYDIVAVQEDFNLHSTFAGGLTGYNYATNHTGAVPGGDGLNVFTKNMPIYNETRGEWYVSYGVIDHGADEMTPKGFVYTVIDIGNGIYIDFYNLHADAYGDEGSMQAREYQFRQICDFIKERSAENDRPVIVTGDFNIYMHTHEANSNMYEYFIEDCGFKDAWVEVKNDSDYYNMHKWHVSGLPAWGNWDSVERFFYKGCDGVGVIAKDFNFIEVLNAKGKPASDHSAAECEFEFIKTDAFEENTQKLEVVTESTDTAEKTLKWLWKDFVNAITHLDQIFTAIIRVIQEAAE